VHHVFALTQLAAEALPEQLGDVGLVIDDQDANAHAGLSSSSHLGGAAAVR
jgi:hypothetical protein